MKYAITVNAITGATACLRRRITGELDDIYPMPLAQMCGVMTKYIISGA